MDEENDIRIVLVYIIYVVVSRNRVRMEHLHRERQVLRSKTIPDRYPSYCLAE